jgi:YggT family protein
VHFLEAVTDPILRPLRRIIPPLGGVDITPIIALLIIQGLLSYVIPQR